MEKRKKENEKNTSLGKNENEIRTLSILNIKYLSLQRCIDFKQTITNNDFENFFIRDLNLNAESAIQLEASPLDNATTKTNVSLVEIDSKLNEAKENLEKLKVERKNADEARVLTRSKDQSQTDENYMDYHQQSSGQTNPDFERKSFYQWQWQEMQQKGKQYFEQVK